MPRRVTIETVGCQMNVLDSELALADLLQAGYEPVDDSQHADVILFNTCSVRQHAEDKIYSALGRLKHIKRQRPGTIIGVLGCMAQRERQTILHRAPHVDLVVGPGQLARLPELIRRVEAGEGPIVELSLDRRADAHGTVRASFLQHDPPRMAAVRPIRQQAMVRIMFGCDKFCTYCIVPAVRGPEQSRPAEKIVAEVRRLAEDGCLEVTLLGQTVNSYRDTSGERPVALADLLAELNEIEGLRRLKFVTSHPRHITTDLICAVRDLPKVSPYLHVPAQSGSDRILKRMRRGYTAGRYREMLSEIRVAIPEAAVTSDFIVGFPGETEEDYRQTVELLSESRFKNSFIFKYSPRPKTKAVELYEDDVPDKIKRQRNNELLAIQNAISLEDAQAWVGRQAEILVEGPSKAARKKRGDDETIQLVGRTVCDRIVVFDGRQELTGTILPVTIEKVDAFTLFGRADPSRASRQAESR
ncbi:MAG: tRNA (N6-isopentenyl adenosine(37)-C2)-methylthiotransferase MiaB [Candidatus Nealsonbacteria bacterium]|nr:tRNA (N6-isopentenyl adenosine(37)-C2)-methylthiotransferase MiaB [Candidatus Nealsonbacteria bacterium]